MNRRSLIIVLACTATSALCGCSSNGGPEWTVTAANLELGDAHGTDEFGDYAIFYFGIRLTRGDEQVVLVYERWPDGLTIPQHGDSVVITTDLEGVENTWIDDGYSVEDVEFEIMSPERDRF